MFYGKQVRSQNNHTHFLISSHEHLYFPKASPGLRNQLLTLCTMAVAFANHQEIYLILNFSPWNHTISPIITPVEVDIYLKVLNTTIIIIIMYIY